LHPQGGEDNGQESQPHDGNKSNKTSTGWSLSGSTPLKNMGSSSEGRMENKKMLETGT
jgi:hypothetical protein